MLYLDQVFKLKDGGSSSKLTDERYCNNFNLRLFIRYYRKKLQKFLEDSSHYRASVLLNRVQDTDLYSECAILYGRVSVFLTARLHMQSFYRWMSTTKHSICLHTSYKTTKELRDIALFIQKYNTDRTVLNDYGAAIMLGLQ